MQVFNVFLKVLRRVYPMLLIYVVVFFFFAIALTHYYSQPASSGFSVTKTPIAVTSDDDSALARGLEEYLSQNAAVVALPDTQEARQDALFYRKVEYIAKIPAGFTQRFMAGDPDALIDKTEVPGSETAMGMDLLINRYLSDAALYARNIPGITSDQIAADVKADLAWQADVRLESFGGPAPSASVFYYFQYLAYTLLALLIVGVASIMMTFNRPELKMRNACSPIPPLRINLQLILGCLAFAVAVWVFITGVGLLIYGRTLSPRCAALLAANSLVFLLVCLSISFLVGHLITSYGAMSAVANVLSLGMSFLCGVFVPQQLLGGTVRTLASFLPAYWYVKAINDLQSLSVWSVENLRPVIYSLLIQLGFAVAIVAVGLVVSKQKRLRAS